MIFYVAFFEMRLSWIYLVVVLGVVRGQSTLKSHHDDESSEMTTKVNEDHYNNTDEPFDLTDLKDIDLRRHKGRDIWMWDLFCHLQPAKGRCQEDLTRYFYDSQLDACSPFNYTGCNGNQNNFETATECERRCKGANFMGVNEQSLPTVCYLQPDSGLCLAFMTNYYYDVESSQCKEFIYGGCGGNLNRFETKADCQEHCSLLSKATITTTTERENPELPPVGVPANAYL